MACHVAEAAVDREAVLDRDGHVVAHLITQEDLAFFEELEDLNDLRLAEAARKEGDDPLLSRASFC